MEQLVEAMAEPEAVKILTLVVVAVVAPADTQEMVVQAEQETQLMILGQQPLAAEQVAAAAVQVQ